MTMTIHISEVDRYYKALRWIDCLGFDIWGIQAVAMTKNAVVITFKNEEYAWVFEDTLEEVA